MIASHPDVAYFDELLNLHEGGPSEYLFQHITEANERPFRRFLRQRMDEVSPRRALLKDPMALMSADWLARRFEMRVVVMIRHPAAFASSVKLLDWPHLWEHFLNQPRLVEARLKAFEPEMRALAAHSHDLIADANLAWRVCHRVIRQYQEEHPDWLFVRHEDLSRDPLGGFARLFEQLGLDFTNECRDSVRAHSLEPVESTDVTREGGVYEIKRNSAANLWNWRTRLSAEELDRLRHGLADFEHFYPEPLWSF